MIPVYFVIFCFVIAFSVIGLGYLIMGKNGSDFKIFVVTESGYYSEEYWDTYTSIDKVFSSKEKALNYILSTKNAKYDEESESYKVGDEDKDACEVRFYDIVEEDVEC